MQQAQEDEAAPSNRREATTAIRSTEIICKSILGEGVLSKQQGANQSIGPSKKLSDSGKVLKLRCRRRACPWLGVSQVLWMPIYLFSEDVLWYEMTFYHEGWTVSSAWISGCPLQSKTCRCAKSFKQHMCFMTGESSSKHIKQLEHCS